MSGENRCILGATCSFLLPLLYSIFEAGLAWSKWLKQFNTKSFVLFLSVGRPRLRFNSSFNGPMTICLASMLVQFGKSRCTQPRISTSDDY